MKKTVTTDDIHPDIYTVLLESKRGLPFLKTESQSFRKGRASMRPPSTLLADYRYTCR
jgi:hypothetical protein